MNKLFKMLGIGDEVSVSITKNEKLLICVGTNGVKVFDLSDADEEFVPAVEFYDAGTMVNVLTKTRNGMETPLRASSVNIINNGGNQL